MDTIEAEARLLIAEIERAFASVTLEDGVSIREADVIDDYGSLEDRQKARSRDELKDWRRIPDDLLEHFHWSLSFFDAKGMRFHLPAYMAFAVRLYLRPVPDFYPWIIYSLDSDGDSFALLSKPQKAAVRRFLTFFAAVGDNSVSRNARCALGRSWLAV